MGNGQNGSVPPPPIPAPSSGNYEFINKQFEYARWYPGSNSVYNLTLTIITDQDQLDVYQYVRANSGWDGVKPLNLTLNISNGVNIYSSNYGGMSNTLPNNTTTRVPGPRPAMMFLKNTGSAGTGTQNGFIVGNQNIFKVYNYGVIYGARAVGGIGGNGTSGATAGSSGTSGGTAIYTDFDIYIENWSNIYGAGGGGGGGGGMYQNVVTGTLTNRT